MKSQITYAEIDKENQNVLLFKTNNNNKRKR